jgi:hypothetical protein
MTRRFALTLLCGLLLGASTVQAWLGPFDLLGPALPNPGDVIKVIDALTRKDSSTSMDVKVGSTIGHRKLLIARTSVEVALERSSRNWRGPVVVRLNVPSDVSYSIDLAKIQAEHLHLDEQKRQLTVTMPPLTVEDVTPRLPSVTIDNAYKRARFKFIDTGVSRELQNVMLREDYQAKARKAGEDQLPKIREEARAALQEFLQKLLAGPYPGLEVVVE